MRAGSARLQSVIFSHYARSALIPILTIELLLVAIYFSVNAYTNHQAEIMLRGEVMSVMPHLAQKQADLIDTDFKFIALSTDCLLYTSPSPRD